MTPRILLFLVLLCLPEVSWANPAHDQVQKMSSTERNTFFTKFLRGSGESCDQVTRNFLQGVVKSGTAVWHVACRNGKAYAINIYNDAQGSTKILDCQILKAVKAGECFKK